VGSCWLLYYCIVQFKYLRLACFISSLANLGICSTNLARVIFPNFSSTNFWISYEIISALYATIMWTCLLYSGTKFYDDENWYDPVCKSSIISIIILNIIHWITAILIIVNKINQPTLIIFILQAIFWMVCGICTFIYTFTPILTVHFNHVGLKTRFIEEEEQEHGSNIIKKKDNTTSISDHADSLGTSMPSVQNLTTNFPKYHINSENASVGTWYMITIGSLTVLYASFYIITFIISSSTPFEPITNSVDFILRIGFAIIYGVPPSKTVLVYLSSNVLKIRSTVIKMSDMGQQAS